MITGMGKQSMTTLRERRAERGLVQMSLWIREEDREAFTAAVAPFRERAGERDPAHKPGRKPLEALRGAILQYGADQGAKPARAASEARREACPGKAGHQPALPPGLSGQAAGGYSQRDEG
jgi:hypothetical protein